LNLHLHAQQAHDPVSHNHTLFSRCHDHHEATTTTAIRQENKNNDQRSPSLQQQWPAPADQILHPTSKLPQEELPPDHSISVAYLLTLLPGHSSPTTPNLRNLHPRLRPPEQQLQLPPAPTPPHTLNLPGRIQRRALPRNLPALRHALLHRHLHIHREPARPAGPHTCVCGESGLFVRGCVRVGFDFQF